MDSKISKMYFKYDDFVCFLIIETIKVIVLFCLYYFTQYVGNIQTPKETLFKIWAFLVWHGLSYVSLGLKQYTTEKKLVYTVIAFLEQS